MEGYFYTNLLGNIAQLLGKTDLPWVGSIRWNEVFSIDINVVNQMLSDKTLVEAGVEVISFFDPLPAGVSLQVQADHNHPGLTSLIEYVLQAVGERKEDIDKLRLSAPAFKGLFSYGFATKPILMPGFVKWLSELIIFLTTDIKAQEMVWNDSISGGPAKVIQERFGSPFVPLHPFFGERLVSYYFNSRGYKIITVNQYNATKSDQSENNIQDIQEPISKLEYVRGSVLVLVLCDFSHIYCAIGAYTALPIAIVTMNALLSR